MIEADFHQFYTDFVKNLYEYDYKNKKNDTISWEWVSGGITGGSCYDGLDDHQANHYSRSSEKEPKVTPLDEFLMKYFPEMKFFDYKKIINYVSDENYTEHEYYGNSTDYERRVISRENLLKVLKELKYIA